MNYFGIIALLIAVAAGVYFLGQGVESIQTDNTKSPGVYQNAIDSAKEVTGQAVQKAGDAAKDAAESTGVMVTVYDGVSVPVGAKTIDVSGKGYAGSLKGEIRLLTELRTLNLSNNKFTGVPAEVGQLSKLEVLNLSNNPFTGLPSELANLKNLKVLDLRGTQYAKQDLEVIKKGLPATTQILVD